MLARDRFGYVHNIPDTQFAQMIPVAVDGLGNPLGWDLFQDVLKPAVSAITNPIGSIAQAAGSILPAVGGLLNPLQAVGNIVGGLFPGQTPPPPPAPVPAMAPPQPSPFLPGLPFLSNPQIPQMPQMPTPFPGGMSPGQFPLGWQQQSLPYTGLGPQRMYMRCAVWPGPAGLVPSEPGPPSQMLPGQDPQSYPGYPNYPGFPSYPSYPRYRGGGGRRYRRFRRR